MWARKFIEFKEFIPWLESNAADTKFIEPQSVQVLTEDKVITSDYLKNHAVDLVKGIALRGDNRPPEKMENGHIPDKCSNGKVLPHYDVKEHRQDSNCSGMVSLTIKPKIAHGFGKYQYKDNDGNYYMYAAKFTKGVFAQSNSKLSYLFEAEVTVLPNDNEIVGYTKCNRVKNVCNNPYIREDLSDAEKNLVSASLTAETTRENICDNPQCFDQYDLYDFYSIFQSNFLTGISLAACIETLEISLKKQNYTSEKIYWISQCIRGLTFLTLGSSLLTTISIPVFHYLLKEYLGLSEQKTNYLTRGAALALSAITSPFGLFRTSLTISAGVTGSIASSYTYNLAKSGFFALKNAVTSSNIMHAMCPPCFTR